MAVLKFGLSMGIAIGLLGIPGHAATAQQDPDGRASARRVFEERVTDYMDLHHRLERSLPPVEPSATIEPILARYAALASAIEAARPHAVQGNIFTAEVAGWFRRVIARALDGVDAEELLADLYAEDWAPSNFHPRVHDHYPAWATHEMPPALLAHLPNLPAGLRYQLIDHDLVLWDVDADLIVDFVEDAILRRGGDTIVARDGSPCRSGARLCFSA
jgi:hypothetical protein